MKQNLKKKKAGIDCDVHEGGGVVGVFIFLQNPAGLWTPQKFENNQVNGHSPVPDFSLANFFYIL